jgi:hypothetical protein
MMYLDKADRLLTCRTRTLFEERELCLEQEATTIPTTVLFYNELQIVAKLLKGLEAAIGIEPMNKGFADLCLTTWLRRLGGQG